MIPWKLIVFLLVAIVLALFIGFNLENKCEISFVFGKVESVPVYLTVLISFVAGLVAALPFAFRRKSKKAKQAIGAPSADAAKPVEGQGMPDAGSAPSELKESGSERKVVAESGNEGKKKRNASRKSKA